MRLSVVNFYLHKTAEKYNLMLWCLKYADIEEVSIKSRSEWAHKTYRKLYTSYIYSTYFQYHGLNGAEVTPDLTF